MSGSAGHFAVPDRSAGPGADALLLVAPGCPHCAAVLEGLGTLVKEGLLGRLEVVNIGVRPEVAREVGARAAPWLRLGEVTLVGLHSPAELRQWAERSGSEAGLAAYFDELLQGGRRAEVEAAVRATPERIGALVALLVAPETGIHARLGAMAILEGLADSRLLTGAIPRLAEAARGAEGRIRVDALHVLSLAGGPQALAAAEACLSHPSEEVREAAREALALLGQEPHSGVGP